MVYTDKISQEALDFISDQITARVKYLSEQKLLPPAASITMGRSFSLWMLGANAIASLAKRRTMPDLLKLAINVDSWHHQIRSDKQDLAYGRSSPVDHPIRWSLGEVFVADMAKRIQLAMAWVEEHVKKDFLIRLLVVPAYQVVAFWLINESAGTSHVLIIDAPPKFPELQRNRLLSSREFLEALHKEQHVVGVHEKRSMTMASKKAASKKPRKGRKLTGSGPGKIGKKAATKKK
jgi:hypothetical protein